MIRIGIRAHDFGRLSADELATRVAAQDLSAVQLALDKAIAGLDLRPGGLNSGLAAHLAAAFARRQIQVAVLSCYINPIHPDLTERGKLLAMFKEHLRVARDLGCGLVALESGSINADYSPHPENHSNAAFEIMLASIAELVAEAEHCGVMVGLEAVTSHVVSTPQKMRRTLDCIGSNNLQVVFDPQNLLCFENHRDQQRIFNESLDLFGDRIAVVHAKDFVAEAGELKMVRVGCGQLDYASLLPQISLLKPFINVLLEGGSAENVRESAGYLLRIADSRN